jgi:sec-independent protein translocase protein TatC
MGFLVTLPLFLYQFIGYLHPALLPRERKVVLWTLPLFLILFIAGMAFSYYFLIPETFSILYPFTTGMGVTPFFSLDEFIRYVMFLLIGVGVMFLLPLFVILLSYLQIISPEVWMKRWRLAVMFFLILSAIITPDVVTMFILFIPLILLYFGAYYLAKKVSSA